MTSIADGIVQDEYKVVYKEIFIQMMEQQKRFAITWILKPVYYFIGKERLVVYRSMTMAQSIEGLKPIYVNILRCWDFYCLLDDQ